MVTYTPHKHERGEIFLGNGISVKNEKFTSVISHEKGFSISGYWAGFVLKFKYVNFEKDSSRCGGGLYLLKKSDIDEDGLCLIWDGEEIAISYPSYNRDELMFELTDEECGDIVDNVNEVRNFLQTLKSS